MCVRKVNSKSQKNDNQENKSQGSEKGRMRIRIQRSQSDGKIIQVKEKKRRIDSKNRSKQENYLPK